MEPFGQNQIAASFLEEEIITRRAQSSCFSFGYKQMLSIQQEFPKKRKNGVVR